MKAHGYTFGTAQAPVLLAACALVLSACSPAPRPAPVTPKSTQPADSSVVTTITTDMPAISDRSTPTARLTLMIASERLTAGSDQLAFVMYTNHSDQPVTVSMPLDVTVRVTNPDGQLVSAWRAPRPHYPVETTRLAAGASTDRPALFVVPGPGTYRISAVAEGLETAPIRLTAAE